MKSAKLGIFFVFLSFIIADLHPSTGRDTEVTCPLCGATVSYWKQVSYSIFTYGLDLKPIGAARIPQPVPGCENCGFVFIEEYFTDDEINILRTHIIEEDIFSGRENLPKYYYLALELELLGNKNYDEMIYFYVCAVWEYSFNLSRVNSPPLWGVKLGVRGICSPAYAKISRKNLQYPAACGGDSLLKWRSNTWKKMR